MPIPLIPLVPNHRWLAPPDIKPSGCWQKRSRNAEPKACRGSTEVAEREILKAVGNDESLNMNCYFWVILW